MLAIPELAMPKTRTVTTVCNCKREVWTDYEQAKAYFLELMMFSFVSVMTISLLIAQLPRSVQLDELLICCQCPCSGRTVDLRFQCCTACQCGSVAVHGNNRVIQLVGVIIQCAVSDLSEKFLFGLRFAGHVRKGFIRSNKCNQRDNISIFDFALTDEDMTAIRALDKGKGTHDPDNMANAVTLGMYHIH